MPGVCLRVCESTEFVRSASSIILYAVRVLIDDINDRLSMHGKEIQDVETVYKSELKVRDERISKLWAIIVILLIALGFSLKKLFT